jgi:hypothetical protein
MQALSQLSYGPAAGSRKEYVRDDTSSSIHYTNFAIVVVDGHRCSSKWLMWNFEVNALRVSVALR